MPALFKIRKLAVKVMSKGRAEGAMITKEIAPYKQDILLWRNSGFAWTLDGP